MGSTLSRRSTLSSYMQKLSSPLLNLAHPTMLKQRPICLHKEISREKHRIAVTSGQRLLVYVCLHDMAGEYRVFLGNLSFSSFSKLMEAVWRTNELVRKSSKFNTSAGPTRLPQTDQHHRRGWYSWLSKMPKRPGHRSKRPPGFTSLPLSYEESCTIPRAVGGRPGHLSFLRTISFPQRTKRLQTTALPPKEGAPFHTVCSVHNTVRWKVQGWRDFAPRRWSPPSQRIAFPKAPGLG